MALGSRSADNTIRIAIAAPANLINGGTCKANRRTKHGSHNGSRVRVLKLIAPHLRHTPEGRTGLLSGIGSLGERISDIVVGGRVEMRIRSRENWNLSPISITASNAANKEAFKAPYSDGNRLLPR